MVDAGAPMALLFLIGRLQDLTSSSLKLFVILTKAQQFHEIICSEKKKI